MEILKGVEIVDLGLWLKKEKILVISDLHIGYEGMLEHQGVFVPKFQLKDILGRLERILDKVKPEKIVVSGDLKHAFGEILKQEWQDTLKLLDFLLERCGEVILVKGNHDVFLEPIASRKGIKIVDDYSANNFFITHGDKIKETSASIIIIGHEHSAINLKEGVKRETYKCFLKGKWQGKKIIVLPSFNPISDSADAFKGGIFSPYLKDLSNFEVYVVGDKVYDFGKVKNLSQFKPA